MDENRNLSKLEQRLLNISIKFSEFLDLIILVALIIVALLVFALFLYDLYKLVYGSVDFEIGIVSLLGTLLLMWAIGELMTEEIKHFKSGEFTLIVFVGVGLAAMIRKILIISLSDVNKIELIYYGFVVLVLGIIYWLLKR